MPDEFKDEDGVVAYRNYYQSKNNIRYKTIPFPNWWQGVEVTA